MQSLRQGYGSGFKLIGSGSNLSTTTKNRVQVLALSDNGSEYEPDLLYPLMHGRFYL